MAKNYRLPIESPYLRSAVQGELFRVPAVEFEYIVFVIRMILKHSTWDAILGRQGKLKATERRELSYLQERVDGGRVDEFLRKHLPYVGVDLFRDCVQALQPSTSAGTRARVGHRLQASLRANARRPAWQATYLKFRRRVGLAVRRRLRGTPAKYQLAGGGAMIALVGGDGAGKSTALEGLHEWLSRSFDATRVHMGKPDWSLATLIIRGMVKAGQVVGLYPPATTLETTLAQKSLVSPGYPWLLREACRARDRYHTYLRARRFAAQGGLAILDRYPISRVEIMDGRLSKRFVEQLATGPQAGQLLSPRPTSRLTRTLVEAEERYYRQVACPELLIVLKVDPEIAVQRKTEEDADSVRRRSTAIWETDWERMDACVIDASKSKEDVLAELKSLIWSEL
jgi:thymidylate kinase